MNTRILRLCSVNKKTRRVRGLGQLQPCLFTINRHGSPQLCIETATPRGPAYATLQLPQSKEAAKKLFAALENARRSSTDSDAMTAWKATR